MSPQRATPLARSSAVTPSRSQNRGFALLITITLLAFLVLLLVSLASLTRVETQVANNAQELAKARQNALFALNIALGQLQKAAGPDQRVTARAEVVSSTIQNPLWTGVWGRTSAPDAYLTSPTPSTATTGSVLNWLISGNEGVTFTADSSGTITTPPASIPVTPAVTINNLQTSTDPLATDLTMTYGGSTRKAVLLVGSNSATPADPSKPATAYVAAPLVDITTAASSLPGFSSTDSTSTSIGRYAWWVGDEGVKARANLSTPSTSPTSTIDKLNRLRVAQRSAFELFDNDTVSSNALALPAIVDPKLSSAGNWISPGQFTLLGTTSADTVTLSATAKLRYHDFSAYSNGVQADVNKGGLKMDLSTAFEYPDATFDASDLSAGAAAADRVAVRGTFPNKFATFTYTRDLGRDTNDSGAPLTETLKLRGPTWQALRSHYRLYMGRDLTNPNLPFAATAAMPNARSNDTSATTYLGQNNNIGAQFNNSTLLDPNTHDYTARPYISANAVPRMTSAGIAPYINRITYAFGLRTEQVGLGADGQRIYRALVVVTPFVVLHNPYNVPLQLTDTDNPADGISGYINTGSMPFRIRLTATVNKVEYNFMPDDDGKLPSPANQSNTYASSIGGGLFEAFCINQAGRNAFNDGANSFHFAIPSCTIAPGAMQIFSPEKLPTGNGLTEVNAPFLKLSPNAYYDGGYYLSRLNGQGFPIWYMATSRPPVLCPTGPGNATTAGIWQPTRYTIAAGTPTAAGRVDGTELNTDNYASDLWVPDVPLKLEVTPDDWGFYYRYRYTLESSGSTDSTKIQNINNVSFLADMQIRMVQATKSPAYISPNTAQTNMRAYTNYTGKIYGGQNASSYAGQTVYLYAMDVYVKNADSPPDRVARPFITSNPMALVQNHNALGDNNSYGKTNAGYPTVMPYVQSEHLDLGNGSKPLAQVIQIDPDTGTAFWGNSKTAAGQSTIKLIEVPNRPMTSLAEFQHANLSLYGYQPYFTAGNSYALPYIPTDKPTYNAFTGRTGSATNSWTLYDSSYFLNEALWDSAFFSTISPGYSGTGSTNKFGQTPATTIPSIITGWQAGTTKLPNSRMQPYASSAPAGTIPLVASGSLSTKAHRTAAASLLTAGSFNVNSQSVDAWAAVLAGARKAGMLSDSAGTIEDLGSDVAIPRITPNPTTRDGDPTSVATWTGFARLTPADIRALAQQLVTEIRTRQTLNGGRPFLTLAEFINRALRSTDITTTRTGNSGALQAALDATVNSTFNAGATTQMATAQADSRWPFRAPNNGIGPASSTALGFLLQADVLQQIGPSLSARSDTFTIRTYGDVLDPLTSTSSNPVVKGRAWCEAVVQRVPDFVDQTDTGLTASGYGSATPLSSLNSNLNKTFGRRFKVVSFRWLTPGDI